MKNKKIICISLILQAFVILFSFMPCVYKVHMQYPFEIKFKEYIFNSNFYCGEYVCLPSILNVLCFSALVLMIVNCIITYLRCIKDSFCSHILFKFISILTLIIIIAVTIIAGEGMDYYDQSKYCSGFIDVDWMFYIFLGFQIAVSVLNITEIILSREKDQLN